jgi:ubiquinone/menaquinone biosynthesis C-methylase UbiE
MCPDLREKKIIDGLLTPLRLFMPHDFLERRGMLSVRQERNRMVMRYAKGRLLDIGCGKNLLVRDYGRESVGVDVYDFKAGGIIIDDSSNLPFRDGSFDTVSFVASLNHIPGREDALREAARVLNEKGRIVLTVLGPFVGRLRHKMHWIDKKEEERLRKEKKTGEEDGLSDDYLRNIFKTTGFILKEKKRFQFFNNLYVFERSGRVAEDRKERTKKYFDDIRDRYGVDGRASGNLRVQENNRRAALRIISDISCGRMLEIGAGNGLFIIPASRKMKNCAVFAADYSVEMLKALRKRAGVSSRIVCVAADALKLPFAEGSMDMICMINAMANIPKEDVGTVFENVRWILKREGFFYFEFKNLNNPIIAHKDKNRRVDIVHTCFKPGDIFRMAGDGGFEVIKTEGIGVLLSLGIKRAAPHVGVLLRKK